MESVPLGTDLLTGGRLLALPLTEPKIELLVWLILLAVLVAVASYVIGRIRARAVQKELFASELLSKFEELHSRGELSDAEFRTIKTTLAEQLQEELKDDGETG